MILLQVRWIGRKLCVYFGRMLSEPATFPTNLDFHVCSFLVATFHLEARWWEVDPQQQKTINTSSDTSQSVNHRAVVKESGVHEHDTVLSFLLCGLGKRTATLADILRLHVNNLSRTINPHSFFRHCFQNETINTAVSTKEKF